MGDLYKEGPHNLDGTPAKLSDLRTDIRPVTRSVWAENDPGTLTFTDEDGYVLCMNVQTVPGQGRSFARAARGLEADFKK